MFGIALSSARKACKNSGCGTVIFIAVFLLGVAFGIDCLLVWAAMALWNACLVAALPILAEVGYWQMWGIYLLMRIVFAAKANTNVDID